MDLELEIFRNLFVSIAEEMGVVLRRTSYSPNIKERRDYSCAVYDAAGETIAMGDHMPVHLGAMPVSVKEALAAHELAPGDVVILNDPFRGGTHLPDITSVAGVFVEGRAKPEFYVATRAHHADVGGVTPGSMPLATEIFQEGLRIPPVKLIRGGEFDEDLLALILANVRTPEERRGDLEAQLAAHRVGERRLLETVAKYGLSKVIERIAALQDYAERLMRARLEGVPDGVYRFEDFLDDDGFSDQPIRISCKLTIRGDCGGSRLQRVRPADARRRQRQPRRHRLRHDVLLSLLDSRGRPLQRRTAAADRRGDQAGHGGRRSPARRRRRGQR